MGVLEFHPWPPAPTTRTARLLVFDLDPGEGVAWNAVKQSRRRSRPVLAETGLQSFVRTSEVKACMWSSPSRAGIPGTKLATLPADCTRLPGCLPPDTSSTCGRRCGREDLRRLPPQSPRRDVHRFLLDPRRALESRPRSRGTNCPTCRQQTSGPWPTFPKDCDASAPRLGKSGIRFDNPSLRMPFRSPQRRIEADNKDAATSAARQRT